MDDMSTPTMGARALAMLYQRGALIAALVMFVTLVAGTIYAIYLGDELRFPDEREYHTLARSLIDDTSYSLRPEAATAYRPPGYPFLIAIPLALFDSIVAARILNFIALAASLGLLFRLLSAHGSRLAALLGLVMMAGYPVLFFTAGTLYPQTFGLMFFLLSLFLLLRDPPGVRSVAGAAVAYGLLLLTIPSFLFLLPCYLFALWLRLAPRDAARAGAIFVAVALAIVVPWTARNYLLFDRLVPVSTNSGINLLLGNSPNTTPTSGYNVDVSQYTEEAMSRGLNEAEQDAYFRSAAVDWILDNKQSATELYVLKLARYFDFRAEVQTEGQQSSLRDLVMLITYGPLFVLFCARLALARRFPLTQAELVLLSFIVLNALATALFFPRIRFRLPFDVLMIGMVAVFLAQITEAWVRNQTTARGWAAGGLRQAATHAVEPDRGRAP